MINEPTDAMLEWIEQHEIESYDSHLESQFEDWVMCVTDDELIDETSTDDVYHLDDYLRTWL